MEHSLAYEDAPYNVESRDRASVCRDGAHRRRASDHPAATGHRAVARGRRA